MSQDASVKLPITVTHNIGASKARRYTASYGPWQHPIEAEGPTPAEAKTALVAALVTAIDAVRRHEPKFARDDDGSLMVAVPTWNGGSDHWRVRDDGARLNTFASTPPAEAFGNCYHMTVIPNRI